MLRFTPKCRLKSLSDNDLAIVVSTIRVINKSVELCPDLDTFGDLLCSKTHFYPTPILICKRSNSYQFKAAMAEISNAAAMGAITGAIAATLISGLEHFLAVERGEMEIDQAIVAVFLDALEGAVIGGLSSAAFAAMPAFIPALVPILNIISVPLMVIGGFQLVNQIGQILDRHEFIKRNALLTQVHKQEVNFFESFDKKVVEYLYS